MMESDFEVNWKVKYIYDHNQGVEIAESFGPSIRCYYCKTEFKPHLIIPIKNGETRESAKGAIELAVSMLEDGAPLECGKCRSIDSDEDIGFSPM